MVLLILKLYYNYKLILKLYYIICKYDKLIWRSNLSDRWFSIVINYPCETSQSDVYYRRITLLSMFVMPYNHSYCASVTLRIAFLWNRNKWRSREFSCIPRLRFLTRFLVISCIARNMGWTTHDDTLIESLPIMNCVNTIH